MPTRAGFKSGGGSIRPVQFLGMRRPGFASKVFAWASFEDYVGDIPKVQAEIIETGLIEKVPIRGRYTKLGIEDFKDIFDLGIGAFLLAQEGGVT